MILDKYSVSHCAELVILVAGHWSSNDDNVPANSDFG